MERLHHRDAGQPPQVAESPNILLRMGRGKPELFEGGFEVDEGSRRRKLFTKLSSVPG